jgi:hypothetical protein
VWYLVIITQGEPTPASVRLDDHDLAMEELDDGAFVVTLDNEDAETDAPLEIDGGRYIVPSGIVRQHLAQSAAAARPFPLSDVWIAPPSDFPTRVGPWNVKPVEAGAVVAGGADGSSPPLNLVAEKQTESVLATDAPLGVEEVAYGNLRQFETYWEPLGWALDEWIGTTSLAPFEDTVHSGVDVSSGGSRTDSDRLDEASRAAAATASDVASGEAVRAKVEAESRSRGWSAGVGGPPPAGSTPPTGGAVADAALAVANPALALAKSVVGASQVKVENATTSLSGGMGADLSKHVTSRIEQDASQRRAASNESLARVANAWAESRRLRALRNLGEGRSENLALFSVVRQWLVTTLEVRPKRIVFIKAHELDQPFEPADLFLHRAVLADRLLDRNLVAALEDGAAAYGPPAAAADPPPVNNAKAERVIGKLVIADPAKGRKSVIRMAVLFETASGDRAFGLDVTADREGTYSFDIEVRGLLRKLAGWRFEFINPGLRWDHRAAVIPIEVEVHTDDGAVPVEIPGPIVLAPGAPKIVGRGFTTPGAPPPHEAVETSGDVQRVLAHLNAKRAYYRLAIDLETDPVTRFARLAARAPHVTMPADLQPVGVAGAHLAFVTGDEGPAPEDDVPVQRVLSTPAGATFVEVLEGRTSIDAAATVADRPKIALAKDESLPWPSPIALSAIEDGKDVPAGESAKTADAAAEPAAELPEKLAKIMDSLRTLQSTVDALKPVAPKPSEDEHGTGEGTDEATSEA